MKKRNFIIGLISLFLSFTLSSTWAEVRGIYLNSTTAVLSDKVDDLIKNSKEAGINTFVIDYELYSKAYAANIKKIKDSGIKYVARVVIFPGGATPAQVHDQAYIQKKLNLVQQAIDMGADEIQIDYIRYKPTQKPSAQNAKDIVKVIQQFKDYVASRGLPLQIDVFGISSFKPSVYIGQNDQLIAPEVSQINPMVYPSHYVPYAAHAKQPYRTVYISLTSLKKQIADYPHVKIVAFIELYNFRIPMSDAVRTQYILAQLQAVKDSGSDGFYFWSAGNKYGFLFPILKQQQQGKLQAYNALSAENFDKARWDKNHYYDHAADKLVAKNSTSSSNAANDSNGEVKATINSGVESIKPANSSQSNVGSQNSNNSTDLSVSSSANSKVINNNDVVNKDVISN